MKMVDEEMVDEDGRFSSSHLSSPHLLSKVVWKKYSEERVGILCHDLSKNNG